MWAWVDARLRTLGSEAVRVLRLAERAYQYDQQHIRDSESAVWAAVGGASVGTFSSSTPFGGPGVVISNTPISTNLVGNTSSAVTLNINLSGMQSLQGGSYTGTLHFQAQATT